MRKIPPEIEQTIRDNYIPAIHLEQQQPTKIIYPQQTHTDTTNNNPEYPEQQTNNTKAKPKQNVQRQGGANNDRKMMHT